MDESNDVRDFEEYAPEIAAMLYNEKVLRVPVECEVFGERVRVEDGNNIVSEVPIPPGIQRIIIEKLKIANQVRVFESLRMGYSAPALKLRRKKAVFDHVIRLWVGSLLEEIPVLVQALGHEDFNYAIVGNWTMIFFREKTKKDKKE